MIEEDSTNEESETARLTNESKLVGGTSEDIVEATEKHESVQKNISKLFFRTLYVSTSLAFTYSMRSNIYILYARTFYDDMTVISITVYLSYLVSAIMSLLFGIIGDHWRFDYLLIIAAFMDVITFFLEASANSFFLLGIVYAIGGQPLESICHGWNIKLQPTYYAQQYGAKYVQFFTLGYLFGPVMGGILSYYFSYRVVFYIAAILATILFVFCIKFFWNVETGLLSQQFDMSQYYENADLSSVASNNNNRIDFNSINVSQMKDESKWLISKDFRFPVLSHNISVLKNDDENETDTDPQTSILGLNLRDWKHKFDTMDKYQKFLLFSMMICACLLAGMEASVLVYYTTYMKDRFNCSVLESTLQICLNAIGVVIASQFVKYVTKLVQNEKIMQPGLRYDYKHYYMISIFVSLIIVFILVAIILPNNIFDLNTNEQFINEYWIAMCFLGFAFGLSYITVELIGIELIPKNIGGSIVGIKIFIRYVGKATACLIVGLLWDAISMEWLWYTHACIVSIILIWMLIICGMETIES